MDKDIKMSEKQKLKYLSLFTGIGGFEIAIHNIFPNSVCIGYSEIDKFAVQVYKHHFPTHKNLGDIKDITREQLIKVVNEAGGCDLVVGGFPCQNLSSLSRTLNLDSRGLEGKKSSLFYEYKRVLDILHELNPNIKFIIENNGSMTKSNKQKISQELAEYNTQVYNINANQFGVQSRNRLYWTNFEVDTSQITQQQTWEDVLDKLDITEYSYDPRDKISGYMNKNIYPTKSTPYRILKEIKHPLYQIEIVEGQTGEARWESRHSRTFEKCAPIIRRFEPLIDTRYSNHLLLRRWTINEMERLFYIPEGWVGKLCSPTRSCMLLGNTVVIKVIEFLLKFIIEDSSFQE